MEVPAAGQITCKKGKKAKERSCQCLQSEVCRVTLDDLEGLSSSFLFLALLLNPSSFLGPFWRSLLRPPLDFCFLRPITGFGQDAQCSLTLLTTQCKQMSASLMVYNKGNVLFQNCMTSQRVRNQAVGKVGPFWRASGKTIPCVLLLFEACRSLALVSAFIFSQPSSVCLAVSHRDSCHRRQSQLKIQDDLIANP